ncbi:F-box and associated interaction domains-containing protein [Hibiscus syriacus]|uniref:F-box and associated interaction domains-containing protein n=1 Tax=Hibiscus syriacus TaxID=106335 RepID=A0A6A2Y8R0_HIBSY|nr:F-box and associated interaction domains-containing protein [Hibiscus syriacus]
MDILSRLPINVLFHCRCVCKTFLYFISDPHFACLHLQRLPLCILVRTLPPQQDRKRFQSFLVDANGNGEGFQVSELNFTPKSNFPTWNICVSLDYKDRDRCFWGLGYSTVTNQYNILQSYSPAVDSTEKKAEIYTIGTVTWRSIGNAPTDIVSLPFNAFLNGVLHWTNMSPEVGEFINSFDFDAEQFGTVPPPDVFQELDKNHLYSTTTGVLGGCLFILFYSIFSECEIWVMKEYGVKESWTNQFVINTNNSPQVLNWESYVPLVVLSNGEILMLMGRHTIAGYNHEREYFRGTKFLKLTTLFVKLDVIAYTPCFASLYDVAKESKFPGISIKQETRRSDAQLVISCSNSDVVAFVACNEMELVSEATSSSIDGIPYFDFSIDDIQLFEMGHSLPTFMIIKG